MNRHPDSPDDDPIRPHHGKPDPAKPEPDCPAPGQERPTTDRSSLQSTREAPANPTAQLARLLDTYLADLEAGRSPDRTRLVQEHPSLAPALEEALAGLDFIRRATPADNQPPLQLGDFRIVREVGRGGMGVVYEAEQISLKRRVALKVLRFGPVADEVAMQRFQREAETVGRLHHTNIVPIFAIGAEESVRYYAMQFIEGRDLGRIAQEMRDQPGSLNHRRIAEWGLQAADALAHAHQRGVIHRDIKPSNLILDAENRIWLTDFGLARRLDDVSLSLTGALLGTPRYMSPEQAAAAHRPIDHRTDLYSLGATLYELATGRPIFEARSAHEVISQILHTEPRAPRTIRPDIPRDLETIILKCLAKEPDHRYPSAQALTEDLRAFVDGRPISARRPRVVERTLRWIRHHRRLVTTAGLSAAASALLAIGGSIAWKSLAAARLGRLQITTASPGALAEILDGSGNPVVPLFPLPNETPIALPAGQYQVRLSAPDTLSETWPIDIAARTSTSTSLTLSPPWLWSSRELPPSPAVDLVPLDDRFGFLVLLPQESGPGKPSQPARLRLVDGETLQPIWPQDLAFDESTLPGGVLAEWQMLLTHWAVAPNFAGTHLRERVTDLDRDGAGDFVLISRSSASLLAVSGASGRVLWWHRSRPMLPPDVPSQGRWNSHPGQSFVVSFPDVADLDDDGIPDVVACFHSNGESFVTPDGRTHNAAILSWIATISGRTGQELWRKPVRGPWSDYVSSSTGSRFETLAHPTLLRLQDRLVVVLPQDQQLRLWEARTGAALEPSPSLGFPLEQGPLYFAAHGTLRSHALVTRKRIETDAHLELVAVDLTTGTIPWRHTALTVLGGVANELDAMPRETFTPVDLEQDGPCELVTLTARHPSPGRWTFGVQVLDAASGTSRWETQLHDAEHPQSIPSDARFLPGPDRDGDGTRDVFVVLPSYDHASKRHGVLAVALSGANGSILWRQHHPGIAGVRSLAWWHPGPDGWPLLVATTGQFVNGRTSTVILTAGSGQIAHTLLDVRDVRIADLDGDGAPELLHPVRSQGTLRWSAIRGQPGQTWRAPGMWLAGPDADADGNPDLFGIHGSTLTARSGRDGHPLWSRTADFAMPDALWLPNTPTHLSPSTSGTTSDSPILATVNLPPASDTAAFPAQRSLAAFSAKDGRKLWSATDLNFGPGTRGGSTLGWAFDYPQVELVDLDGDGSPEPLASHMTEAGEIQLSVVDGSKGRLLWSATVLDGAMAPDPRPAGAPIADFNQDQVRDLALILAASSTPANPLEKQIRVDVRHGITGQSLWPAPFPIATDRRQVAWPEPTLGDLDGDDVPEVLVIRHSGYHADRGYPCELIVLDGRSGQVRWTWSWDAGFPAVWAPLVLTAKDPARRRVALGGTILQHPTLRPTSSGEFEILVLNTAGQLNLHRHVSLIGHTVDRGGLAWGAVDLDGDGTSELLYPDNGFLCAAFGPDLMTRWQQPLAGKGSDGFRLFLESLPKADGSSTLTLWTGRDVFGIDGSRGDILWRGRAPTSPAWGVSGAPHLRLVPNASTPTLPHLQFLPPLGRSDTSSIDQTWPTSPDGGYQPFPP